jgi:hypothetical protein
MSNAALFKKFHTQPISITLLQRRLSFVGHCFRSTGAAYQPINELLFWNPTFLGSRKRGRRINYRKQLLADCEDLTTDEEFLKTRMESRADWSKFIQSFSKEFSNNREKLDLENFKLYVNSYYA